MLSDHRSIYTIIARKPLNPIFSILIEKEMSINNNDFDKILSTGYEIQVFRHIRFYAVLSTRMLDVNFLLKMII